MKKNIYTFLLLVASCITIVFAQNGKPKASFSGKITDSHNKPLEGATVYILDLKLGASSTASGNFQFANLPGGKYLVEVKLIGYKSVSQTIAFSADTKFNFQLTESYAETGEVVVTGVSKATLIKRNPVPIVSVSHDYLTTNLSTNAIDAIAKIPGVRAVTTGPNVSKPFIRGLGYNRILTLYDGIRQEDQQWGDEHGIEVDQYSIDKIEIIKGPASLSYGSDALAGVVNIIPTQPAPEGKIIGDVVMDYQTNNKYLGGSAMLSGSKNGIEWLGRFSHKEATNYQNKYDGRVFGTAFKETDAAASVGIHRKWGYSHINFLLYDDLQEIPDGSRDSATHKFTRQINEADTVREIVSDADLGCYKIEKLHQHVQHYRMYWSNNFIVGNSNHLAVNFGYQNSTRREYSHPVLYTIPGLYLQLSSFTYDIKYSFREFNNWDITAGINGMYQQNKVTNGTEFIIPDYHQFDIGPFVTAKKTYGKLDIAGGVRFDTRSFKNDELYTKPNPVTGFDMPVYGADTVGASKPFSNFSKTFSGFSGSVGATYNFSDKFSMKANIGRGFRAPNISEISANGVHPGTNIYQIGNPDFKPEFSLQEDIGFLYSAQYVIATLNVFNNVINNYIYNQKLTNPDGTDLVLVPGNQTFQFQAAKAHLYGGEFSLDLHPLKPLHFENSISLVYGQNKGVAGKRVTDSAKYLPFIPPTHGISELRLDFAIKNAHVIKGFVKVQGEFYAAQNRAYLAYNTETPTPGYTLFNAGLGGTFTSKQNKPLFSVYIMGNNLFDVAYQDHLSRLKYFTSYPNPKTGVDGIYNLGRNISFKIEVPIGASL
ncbi:TonB-dependent receptor [Parasediminibacterium sp. JCM 36343]|uniref:TonB-dependent receptor n=1 Tax=Parasediminibacterium sp. JCM 36343 TaxID=3374279 RepID=UPI00397A3C12